jgi:hypothetical protein
MPRPGAGPKIPLKTKTSADALAEKFLDSLSDQAWGKGAAMDPTIVSNMDETREIPGAQATHFRLKSSKSPVTAGICAILFPSGGFFYKGAYGLGAIFFLFFMASLALFLNCAGTLAAIPGMIALLPKEAPIEKILIGSGIATALIGWLMVTWPVVSVKRDEGLFTRVHPFFIVLTSPIPLLSLIVQRRFFWASIQVLCIQLLIFSGVSSYLFWHQGGVIEPLWRISMILSIVGACGLFMTWLIGFIDVLEICDILSEEGFAASDLKFVLLGGAIVLFLMGFALIGPPAKTIQRQGREVAQILNKKEFKQSSEQLNELMRTWESKANLAVAWMETFR